MEFQVRNYVFQKSGAGLEQDRLARWTKVPGSLSSV